MELKNLASVNLKEKTVLYRAPYDIDVKEVNGVLEPEDDMRIMATLPTLEYLIKENCKIVILTYIGRPDGRVVEGLRTTPHAKRLSRLLGKPVQKVDDCIGPAVDAKISSLKPGEILMLENVRFHPEEMIDNDDFAQELCRGKDLVVFDGFPQAHRIHASTTGIERHLPAVAGKYLEKEVNTLSNLLDNPQKPFTVIIGGAKISDKIDAVNNLINVADKIIVGGGVANVFLKAEGKEIGTSFVEDVFVDQKRREKKDWVVFAQEILKKYRDKIMFPADFVISDDISVKTSAEIAPGWAALDIGPKTIEAFSNIIENSGTVFLAGPIGKFEDERFSSGSKAILAAMKKTKGETIIAGGDTITMVNRYGNLADYTHISLAAGATLEFLAGKTLPALVPLMA